MLCHWSSDVTIVPGASCFGRLLTSHPVPVARRSRPRFLVLFRDLELKLVHRKSLVCDTQLSLPRIHSKGKKGDAAHFRFTAVSSVAPETSGYAATAVERQIGCSNPGCHMASLCLRCFEWRQPRLESEVYPRMSAIALGEGWAIR